MTNAIDPCPECKSEMRPIKLIDTGDQNIQREMVYAADEAKRDWFLGRFPEKGKVSAWMCTECGRIILRGFER